MSKRFRQFSALSRLRLDALEGDADAVEQLYRIALQTLPERKRGDADPTVSEAVWTALVKATKGKPKVPVIDKHGDVLIPKSDFKKAVLKAANGRIGDKTVQRFINDREKMFPVVARYYLEFGVKR